MKQAGFRQHASGRKPPKRDDEPSDATGYFGPYARSGRAGGLQGAPAQLKDLVRRQPTRPPREIPLLVERIRPRGTSRRAGRTRLTRPGEGSIASADQSRGIREY